MSRRVAVFCVVLADGLFAAWGAMAAGLPGSLAGPGGKPILPAGFEGYSGDSWAEVAAAFPAAARYMVVLFRMYGFFNVVFGLMAIAIALTAFRRGEVWAWWTLLIANTAAFASAMRYDWIVNAIGPFELSEYLGLAVVYAALAATAPFTTALVARRGSAASSTSR